MTRDKAREHLVQLSDHATEHNLTEEQQHAVYLGIRALVYDLGPDGDDPPLTRKEGESTLRFRWRQLCHFMNSPPH